MQANIPKVFRLPKPKRGIKRGFKYETKKSRVLERSLKKKMLAKEIAVKRHRDKVAEHALQPQPAPMDRDGIPEEMKHHRNLRAAYRLEHYQREYVDPTPYISDQVISPNPEISGIALGMWSVARNWTESGRAVVFGQNGEIGFVSAKSEEMEEFLEFNEFIKASDWKQFGENPK